MGLARSAILWAADNPTLRENLPRFGFVRRTVRRFMPGETLDAALDAAAELRAEDLPTTFTRLGENLADLGEAEEVAEHYVGAFDAIAARGLDTEISVKLTQLGLDLDVDAAARHARRLAACADAQHRRLWIDMESAPYVERTLEIVRRLRADGAPVGVCLQAYLRRTAGDVRDLLPTGAAMRFVKGAYRESPGILVGDRRAIADAYHALALAVLSATDDPGRLALGTHDVDLVRRIDDSARAIGRGRDAYEVQMLYGIRVADQHGLAREGFRVRPLISYGEYWYPWFLRRMAERPANVWMAVRNLVG
ncbi:MAG: proline dehydrogenase family protein [Actinomycetota bacterium]